MWTTVKIVVSKKVKQKTKFWIKKTKIIQIKTQKKQKEKKTKETNANLVFWKPKEKKISNLKKNQKGQWQITKIGVATGILVGCPLPDIHTTFVLKLKSIVIKIAEYLNTVRQYSRSNVTGVTT